MNTFSLVKDIILDKAKRSLKVLQFGAKTAQQIAAFGDDSAPLKDMVAIYSKTSEMGDSIIIGYINKNQIALPGEKRIYSLQKDGSKAADIYLKNDSTIEIGGNTDNFVKYAPLDNALRKQDAAINSELTKIATAITALGGVYVPAAITTNIDNAKTLKIKTS